MHNDDGHARDYDALRQYATERQQVYIDAIIEHGGLRAAGRALNVNPESVRRSMIRLDAHAARSGFSPQHDMVRTVPDGFLVKGVSTLYNGDGRVSAQWVKSRIDPERQAELFRAATEAFASELPREEPVAPPEHTSDKLMAVYPLSDQHFGMLVWGEETEADFDLTIADNLLRGSISYLVDKTPPCDQAMLILLGDFLDIDGYEPVTPTSKNILDVDTRFPKIVDAAIKAIRYAIRKALSKHNIVNVIVALGNHDQASSVWMRTALLNIYENEPRVFVNSSPKQFHYHSFGKNLIGVNHGHGVKSLKDLPIIMANDVPKMWGDTEYRYWYTGHRHKDDVIDDVPGARVECFRVMNPANAWAYAKGFRGKRDLKSIILHHEYGEVERSIVTPKMIEAMGMA